MNPVNYTPREACNGHPTCGENRCPPLVIHDAPDRSKLSPALTPLAALLVKRVTNPLPDTNPQRNPFQEPKTKKSTLGYIRMIRMRNADL